MTEAIVGLCTIKFHLPGLTSLKEKRSILKSLLARLHNTHKVSAAEVDCLDQQQSAVIAIALVSNSTFHTQKRLRSILRWIEENYPQAIITQSEIEIL